MKNSKKDSDLMSESYFASEAVVEVIRSMENNREGTLRCMVARMRAPGGWVVTNFFTENGATSVFVPDPEGSWDIGNEGSLRSKAEEELGLAQ